MKANYDYYYSQVIDFAILIFIAYQYKWYYAAILLILDFAITTFIPVPKSKMDWAKDKMDETALQLAK